MKSHGVTRLRLLGVPAIDGPGAEVQAVLNQPKRLLLLAYLTARDDFVTRDALLGLFWPSLDENRARRALSQALHFLRTTLGPGSIIRRGATEVRIGAAVESDLAEFQRAIRAGSLEAALDLYQGELLSGVIPTRTRELDVWLESERSRLLGLAAGAARKLSDAAYQANDLSTATAWLRRTLEIRPFDESAHREYIGLLHEAGDTAGAIEAHDAFRTRLRKQFRAEPSEDTIRVVNLIRKRSSAAKGNGTPDRGAEPDTGSHAPTTPDKRPTSWVPKVRVLQSSAHEWIGSRKNRGRIGALAAVVVLAAIAGSFLRETKGDSSVLLPNRVAVLYFDVIGDNDQLRFLADGLTEALIGYLNRATSLDVVSANGVRRFRGSAPSLDTIAGTLHAAIIIRGSITGTTDNARVGVVVVDGESGDQSPPITIDSRDKDLLETIDDFTGSIARELNPLIGDAVTLGQWRAGTENPQALLHTFEAAGYVKRAEDQTEGGTEYLVRMAYDAAEDKLIEASRLDPSWAEPIVMQGRVALGRAWFCLFRQLCQDQILAWLDRASDFADIALEVDSLSAGALELKGQARLQRWILETEPDSTLLTEAEESLNHAVMLDWRRARAWAGLSSIHFARADFVMAESAAEQALDVDAFLEERAEIQMRLFQSAFHREHDFEAERWCDAVRAFQREGNWMAAECSISLMAWSPRHEPDIREAWLAVERGLQHEAPANAALVRPRLHMLIAAALAESGDPDSAKAVIERAMDEAVDGDGDILYYAAAAYAALGDHERAKALLKRFLEKAPANRQHVIEYRWFRDLRDEFDPPAMRPGGKP